MFQQQVAALKQQRRYGSLAGLGAFNVEEIAAVQRALNSAYSPSGIVLVIDGIWGSKSRARMREFQSFIGLSVNGNVDDYAALVALGLPVPALPGATVGGSVSYPGTSGASSTTGNTSTSSSSPWSQIAQRVPGTIADSTLASQLGDATKQQLEQLAGQGDLAAKLALQMGTSRGTAQMLILGGVGLAAIVTLSMIKNR